MIDRREFAIGSALVASIAATGVFACQPPPLYDATGEGLQKALAANAKESLVKLFAPSATLSVIDARNGIQTISGPQQIAQHFLDLVQKGGYHFAPSTSGKYQEADEVLSWQRLDEYGWQKASIWRPVSDDEYGQFYALDGCGELHTDSYNLLVSGSPIQSIALVRAELPDALKKVARDHDATAAKKAKTNG